MFLKAKPRHCLKSRPCCNFFGPYDAETHHSFLHMPWKILIFFDQLQDEQLLWIAEHAMNVPGGAGKVGFSKRQSLRVYFDGRS